MLGASTRHFAIDLETLKLRPGESNVNMATRAAQQAISDADIDLETIDLIVMATSTPDYPFPATALFVQEQLGIQNCCVIELRAGCGGMAQAFLIATQLIATGVSRKALLIGSDLISPFVALFNQSEGNSNKDFLVSLAMFGDGAGALILARGLDGTGVIASMSRSLSTGRPPGMILRTGGALFPVGYSLTGEHESGQVFEHDFKRVLAHGPDLIKAARRWVHEEQGYDLSDIDFFVPPQVNARLIDLVATEMEVSATKVFSNFRRVGNTVSASIYIALDQMNREGLLRGNELLVLLPAEATKWIYGGIIVRWTKRARLC